MDLSKLAIREHLNLVMDPWEENNIINFIEFVQYLWEGAQGHLCLRRELIG